MAGHSKWANIKHKKAANDKKRGKIWTKLIREITVAARIGGGDINANPRLRLAVDKGLGANMPKDTIERAIKRGAGGTEGDNYDEIRYEGYGPGGTAVMVDCMTDNRNRTASEVRHAFSKLGGNLGTDGSVSYLFSKQGMISFSPGVDEDAVMEAALEAGAEDVVNNEDGSIDVISTPESFATVKDALVAAGLNPDNDEVTYNASTSAVLDQDDADKLLRMVDMLEDLDDVQNVYTNAEISDEILDAIG
ncbi:MAG: YebC/PmpR family DNA-binding transcriptional regulator [gamma proteobacterium symbiont of Ctena orbiculata]|uniref:Probable transcriptional regulatory protein KME65_16085 n=1 Tax=Candidatus Thiodiazotropha taylori TaxID=2792791 RepID=A0A944MFJ1_9GAMM|nr:YebC/PmpR family DNA-binding transcriptional regulator [Candidatus Thiodiazotropha taylori]PUB89245.1 MAG: YebC/PmpR family DNA-binding transcriptional regulator [gamma proteobacterium symbiont of Ctena orbiculata]MBT2990477.1 YebC/PmpR family DNA-binding transcriptional regulator [Candidatus Thiodiazotropha taylori]MBT2998422.1 YebC/PmpR family DNA-binding transcriptional regulator [Candidatus Thiodiazotropha taylori]MBT3002678.1 YebC/PmpR family DNA-binding transcriptional regulator [Candi